MILIFSIYCSMKKTSYRIFVYSKRITHLPSLGSSLGKTSETDSSCLQGGCVVTKMALSSQQPDYTLDRLRAYPRLLTSFLFLHFRKLVLVNSLSLQDVNLFKKPIAS